MGPGSGYGAAMSTDPSGTTMPTAPFGRTGHRSSRVIFGAAALGAMRPDRAEATLELVRAAGVNHVDTAASYGASEDRLRPWLAQHRREVFLATKTGERAGDDARAELERSLERLGVDQVDLVQLHDLVEPDQWARAFAPDGAVAALARARDEGLTRFVGVTGHGLRIAGMHLRSLDRYPFDSVLFPYNAVLLRDRDYASDVARLLDRCARDGVAVQTIKSIARGRWDDGPTGHFSWYEPLTDPDAITRAVRFVLSNPQRFLNSTSDARLLPHVLAAATGPLDAPDPAELDADVERFGITPLFDGDALERI